MEKPLVSIIIPVFNVEKYIERCLLSVKNQTYSQIECIIINDFTPDNSMQEVNHFIQTENFNPIIINHKENLGVSSARNSGMEVATGKYIYFLDSDDALPPYAIENLVKLAEDKQAEITLGESLCINEKEGWERNYFPINYSGDTIIGNINILTHFTLGTYPVMNGNKLILTDFIKNNQLYFFKNINSEDELWSFQCALKLEKITFLKEITYLYYFHSDSIIHNRGKKMFDSWYVIAEQMDKSYKTEKNKLRKQLILKHLIGFKNMTLVMNWSSQKNETLWKESYKNYKKLSSLSIIDYFKNTFSWTIKKYDFFTTLPIHIGFWVFRKRFGK